MFKPTEYHYMIQDLDNIICVTHNDGKEYIKNRLKELYNDGFKIKYFTPKFWRDGSRARSRGFIDREEIYWLVGRCNSPSVKQLCIHFEKGKQKVIIKIGGIYLDGNRI